MGLREAIIREGNLKRIIEMHNGGCGPNQIAGVFRDFGINIGESAVTGIVSAYEPIATKALPKANAKNAIKKRRDFDKWNDKTGT